VDLDEVADELYTVHPDEFIAVRTERQDRARADGDRELAKQIGGLPKPSTAAWVANVLVREHRGEIQGLVELGGLLREAQENLAGDQLRALNAQRSKLLGALTRQALAVAREHGHPVSTSVEAQVETTLRAAMSDPEAGEALLSGRLTSAMSYSGLGTVGGRPDLRLVTTGRSERAPAASRAGTRAPRRAPADRRTEQDRRLEEERRAAQERHRRELAEAQQAVEEATVAAHEAAQDAATEHAQLQELAVRQQELNARLEQLRAELVRAEHAVVDAAAEVKRAERRQRNAQRAADEAAAARDRAVARAQELARGMPGL
jgi:hypothetical protein